MKVGLDISQTAHPGGVARYTNELTKELSKISDLQMVYFYASLRKPYQGLLKGVKSFKLPPTLIETLFNKFRSPQIEKFIGKLDIYHSSDWTQPKTKARKVTTYHDVIPLKYPQWSHPKIVAVHRRRLALVEREIDIVIAVSEATKRDLLEVSKIPAEKITVIYEAAGDEFKVLDSTKVEEFRKKMNLPDKFILAIGGIGNRRNLERVKKASKGYQLVITGETIPRLDDSELPLLYNAAELLLYPSFYEGFGLPVVEAMACGVPVITSNVSSLPEVGGEAAVYVDPEDLDGMTKLVEKLMADQELRLELRKKGLVQAKKFTWEKCARETYHVYKNLL